MIAERRGHNDMPQGEVLDYIKAFVEALQANAAGLPPPLRVGGGSEQTGGAAGGSGAVAHPMRT
mgnify:CR=1 FL=1